MRYDAELLAATLERPLKTAAILGHPITITLTPGALKALATAIRVLGGQPSAIFTSEQIKDVLGHVLGRTSLFDLVRIWFLIRFRNWLTR